MNSDKSAFLRAPQSQALVFAIVVEAAAFGLGYLLAGRWVAIAALIAGPFILGPIAVQIARRLAEASPNRALRRPSERAMLPAAAIFVMAGSLGAIGLDVPGHPSALWGYVGVVFLGGLWALLAAVVIRRSNAS